MLRNKNAIATVAVKDLGAARRFYEGTLELQRVEGDQEGVAIYQAGDSKLMVYESRYAGTNQATGVGWTVGNDLDDLVRALSAKGVVFEHYELPDMTLEGDVHVAGPLRAAWFKDPDGNIHSLFNG